MKVIFLDIDGVLCIHAPDGNWGAEDDDVLSADCCRRLKEIVDATGCKLVLSSSWRLFRENVSSLFAQLRPFGITRADFLGGTPLLEERGEEILAWLARHPLVGRFIALDDEPFDSVRFPCERLVLTEPASGITEAVKARCIALLNDEKSHTSCKNENEQQL